MIYFVDNFSWYIFYAERIGAYEDCIKWILGYGTKFVWNSQRSTLREPSNLREVVSEETTWEVILFKLV